MLRPSIQENPAMIRTFLVAAGFLSLTVVLFLQQPGQRGDGAPEVTRADAGLDRPVATPVAPAPVPAAETASGVDLASLAPAFTEGNRAALAAFEAQKAEAGDADPLRAMTANVLAELGISAVEGAPTPEAEQMAGLTQGIVAGISAARLSGQAPKTQGGLADLVTQALREGQSDAYIDALLNEAARSGQISVPGALVTSEGRVDSRILLERIVSQATAATANPAAQAVATAAPGQTRPAAKPAEPSYYTVASGDSLGSIAIRFYGDFDLYQTIFEANRGTLSSPDRIRAGQRLVIPAI